MKLFKDLNGFGIISVLCLVFVLVVGGRILLVGPIDALMFQLLIVAAFVSITTAVLSLHDRR